MNDLKRWIARGAAVVAAFLLVAANDGGGDRRPPGVQESQWIPLNDRAGLVLVQNTSSPRAVFTHLWVKRGSIWVQAVVENPTVAWQLENGVTPKR